MKGLFITGTDTNVGKTYIACQIAAQLNAKNINVIPRKPIESGCENKNNQLIPHDATKLKQAANSNDSIDVICPYRFEQAISPSRAASLNKHVISLQSLSNACLIPINNNGFLLVEGAGGFYSPICNDALNADLAENLNLPIVLVAEDKLGCINQILLSIEAIEKRNLTLGVIILNQINDYDFSLMDNKNELMELCSYDIIICKKNDVIDYDFN